MAWPALIAAAFQADQQGKASGGPGLFETASLFSGPQAGDQYGAFKPGGQFAPPSFAQFSAATKGRDVGSTIGAAIAPGVSQIVSALVSGPGRGEARRASARSLVAGSPELTSLRGKILAGSGSATQGELLAVAAIVGEARSLGGLGSKFGERANMLQDVVKWVFTGETSRPKKAIPTLAELEAVVSRIGVGATRQALPVGASVPAGSMPARTSYWSSMGTVYTR